MTTSHRPTLESRKGRDLQQTSIVHSRQVAAHKQLKYRKTTTIDPVDAKEKFNELKLELLQREKTHFKDSKGDDYDYNDRQLAIEDGEAESYEDRMERVAKETKDLDDSSDEEEDQEDEESESESDEDDESDDDAELLKELEKIRKERAQAQLQKQLKEKEESAINSNPLLSNNNSTGVRKNWRQDKVFNYKNNQEKHKTDDGFVNDLLRSDFHQKFLNKYVK